MEGKKLVLAAALFFSGCNQNGNQLTQPDAAITAPQLSTTSQVTNVLNNDYDIDDPASGALKKLKSEIEKTYGVEIVLDNLDKDYLKTVYEYLRQDDPLPLYLEEYSSLAKEQQFKALSDLQKHLSVYPPHLIKNFGPKKIHLIRQVAKLTDTNGHFSFRDFAGLGGDNILLTFSPEGEKRDDNGKHELFHTFDQHSPGGQQRDFVGWLKYTPRVKTDLYPDKNRENACFKQIDSLQIGIDKGFKSVEGCRELFRHELRGYIHTYGLVFEDDHREDVHGENKAQMGAILLTKDQEDTLGIKWFVERAAEDELVKIKLKLLTGCDFTLRKTKDSQPDIVFTRLLSLQEFRVLMGGKGGFDYFRKWSTDDKGVVWMDPQYYDDLFHGKEINADYWANKGKRLRQH